MALIGYEVERKRLSDKISEIQSLLGKAKPGGSVAPAAKKRVLSAAARARIAAAQKKRWAAHHKQAAAAKA
jgi:hypothetical protein